VSEGSSSRRGLFRELARAAAQALPEVPSAQPEPMPAPPTPLLSEAEIERYSRQLALPEWSELSQVALRDSSVLVIGAGALGSPVAMYLAGAGVGRLGIADSDVVEISNLARQPMHFTPDNGMPKVESAAAKLRFLNPDVLVETYQARVTEDNVAGLIEAQDLVVDCSDSFATRYLVNAACCEAGVTLIEGGVVGWSGLVMTIRPGRTACYRCAFPVEPVDAPTCSEAGILGPGAGIIGSLQALEALKVLSGAAAPLRNAFLQVDLATCEVMRVNVLPRPECPDCPS
jgi:molybdopterin/thiamine biosynthesis adenylyltransferase